MQVANTDIAILKRTCVTHKITILKKHLQCGRWGRAKDIAKSSSKFSGLRIYSRKSLTNGNISRLKLWLNPAPNM